MNHNRLVLLSGGSESVTAALADTLLAQKRPFSVVSLVERSLFRDTPFCEHFVHAPVTGRGAAEAAMLLRNSLLQFADPDEVLDVLPTEDDGLYLLTLLDSAPWNMPVRYSRGRALQRGGLDKAELFEHLISHGLAALIAETKRVDDPSQCNRLFDELGDDAVFKPSFKPWQASLGRGGLKVFTRSADLPTTRDVAAALSANWSIAESWVAQRRLKSTSFEQSACVVRAKGTTTGCQVIEKVKYPRMGGSAAWVSSTQETALIDYASAIAEAIDLEGMCEMSFLPDTSGRPRLLELNCRPWLQIELVERSGFPIVEMSLRALAGETLPSDAPKIIPHHWIQPERMALSILHGEYPRFRLLSDLTSALRQPIVIPIYGSRLPGIRTRWTERSLRKALRN